MRSTSAVHTDCCVFFYTVSLLGVTINRKQSFLFVFQCSGFHGSYWSKKLEEVRGVGRVMSKLGRGRY